MSALVVVAAITGTFFIVGLFVGAIIVIALPVVRATRASRADRHEPDGGTVRPEYDRWMPDIGARRDGAAPDDRPRWPGDADNGYGG
jgi:hypothetical protein